MKRILFLLGLGLLCLSVSAEGLSVDEIFTDHMVLQRNASVKVWGQAAEGAEVEVRLGGKTERTKAVDGKWQLSIKSGKAGGPYRMEVISGTDTLAFEDILFGDVWLAGGQSNMEFALCRVSGAAAEIAAADLPMIRCYKVPRRYYEGHDVARSEWMVCSPETAGNISAIAYYYAKILNAELGVPVGIIQTPVGGTTAETWCSRELLLSDREFSPIVEHYDSIVAAYEEGEYERVYGRYQASLAEYNRMDAALRKYIAKPVEPAGKWNFRRPASLSETMLQRAAPYTLKGFIFYQGESNTARGAQYRRLFPAMIAEWRDRWGQGDIPFLFVQLPKFGTRTRYWYELREAQYLTSKRVKNTAMAVSFDQGDPSDIHPTVKDTVGWRLAQLALGEVYGHADVCRSPEFRRLVKCGDGTLLLDFDHTGSGLVARGGTALKGFAVAGEDGKFVAAEAVVEGVKRVRVWSDGVKNPVDVRYLWVNSGEMNLFNREGFPAMPFRSDSYPLVTDGVCVNPETPLPPLDLFLFIGQSNMAGRGRLSEEYKGSVKGAYLLTPEGGMEPARNPLNRYSTIRKSLHMQGISPAYTFAGDIVARTGRKVGLVVNARGGSSINSWLKGAEDGYYDEALYRVRKARKHGNLKAIIWHQGESDSRDPEAYREKLKRLVADLRSDLGDDTLPFIVGELAGWRSTSHEFNRMLRSLPDEIPCLYYVPSDGLTPLIDESDPHFSAEGQEVLGRRYAEAAYRACYENDKR